MNKDEVRSEIRGALLKWAIGAVATLIVLAFSGWYLALKPIIVKELGGVPAGAVLAFDRSKGCPDGWSKFVEGQSRTIIGASFNENDKLVESIKTTKRKYRDHGGVEKVTLDISQIPPHEHVLNAISLTDFYGPSAGLQAGNTSQTAMLIPNNAARIKKPTQQTFPIGGGKPHDNMPPYIALYYCIKD